MGLALLHVLDHTLGIRIRPEDLLTSSGAIDEEDGHWRLDEKSAYKFLEQRAAAIRDFRVEPRTILGNFQFAKMAMVEDSLAAQ